MGDERLPKQLFYGEVVTGARRQCGQRRHKVGFLISVKNLQINADAREGLVEDRPAWKRAVNQQSTKPTGSPLSKPKQQSTSLNRLRLTTPTPSLFHSLDALEEHSAHGPASSDRIQQPDNSSCFLHKCLPLHPRAKPDDGDHHHRHTTILLMSRRLS
ncbi:hypothetical protein SprV_0200876900 [Sparganum proliferum]